MIATKPRGMPLSELFFCVFPLFMYADDIANGVKGRAELKTIANELLPTQTEL
jgi:hypothetical protein